MRIKCDDSLFIFELTLSGGKTKKFRNGYEMYIWASHQSPRMEFFSRDDEQQPISLSEWFERRNSK